MLEQRQKQPTMPSGYGALGQVEAEEGRARQATSSLGQRLGAAWLPVQLGNLGALEIVVKKKTQEDWKKKVLVGLAGFSVVAACVVLVSVMLGNSGKHASEKQPITSATQVLHNTL